MAALFATAVLLASCSGRPPSGGPAAPFRVGFVRIADNAQLFVGVEKGLYQQEGLQIEIQELQSGARILEALVSKSGEGIDIGFSSLVSVLLARSQGLPIVTFAGGPMEDASRPTHGVLVQHQSRILHPDDLKGKTISVNALKNVEHLMLFRYLQRVGVDPTSVTVVEIGFPQMPAVLKAGQIDAACAIEPYLTMAVEEDSARLLAYHYKTVREQMAISSYVSTEAKIASRRDDFHRFVHATQLATDYIASHPEETREIVIKYTKLDPKLATHMVVPRFERAHDTADLEFWLTMMEEQHYLSKPLNVGVLLPEI